MISSRAPLRIAVYQGASVPADVNANAAIACSQASVARQRDGADMIAFPELFLSGYAISQQSLRECARSQQQMHDMFAPTARELGIAIAIPFPERSDTGDSASSDTVRYFNSVALLSGDGQLAMVYRKAHLFGAHEQGVFTAGDRLGAVTTICGWRVAILVCFDIEFAEPARVCALAGAELLIMPTALAEGPVDTRTPLCVVPTRAMENGMFVVYSNLSGDAHCDELGGLMRFCGRSAIIAPDGTDLARARGHPMHDGVHGTSESESQPNSTGNEQLLIAELRPDMFVDFQRRNPYMAVRRPELYGSLTMHSTASQSNAAKL